MSISDKLNYTIEAKKAIQQAVANQGILLPDSAPFGDYGMYISQISGGGGGGEGFVDSYQFVLQADSETSWMFTVSILFVKNGTRQVDVYFDNTIVDTISIDLNDDKNAFYRGFIRCPVPVTTGIHIVRLKSTTPDKLFFGVDVISGFPLYDCLNTTLGMTNGNFASDDGTLSLSLGEKYQLFSYNDTIVTTLVISGNSYIGLGSNTEHIKYNRRDTYISTYYYQLIKLGAINAIKIRWEGWSPYGNKSDPYKYAWELFLFSNGDAMIVRGTTGPNTNLTGTWQFLNIPYNQPTEEAPYVSFYRLNEAGTEWAVDYAMYNIGKSNNIFLQ